MPSRSLTRAEYLEAVEALRRHNGNISRAAKAIGRTRQTFRTRIKRGKALGYDADIPSVDHPAIPDEAMEIDELIEHLSNRFEKRRKTEVARQWMPFKVNIDGPFGLAFFGDPHLEDNGCFWPLLRRDVSLVRDTEAMWGVGLGDYTSNWAGRLAQKIYPHQEATRPQAWQLAEWFFGQKKPNGESMWWLLLKGNHDQWSNTYGHGDPLDWMERGAALLEDWQAKFAIVCRNGREVRVWAAHDFPGSSIYNPLHGPMRKARFSGAMAGLYICGDKHHYALFETQHQETGENIWCARARGYKFIDPHATHLGLESQDYGATITAIIDPSAEGPRAMRCFPDLEEAADFLKFKRRKQ